MSSDFLGPRLTAKWTLLLILVLFIEPPLDAMDVKEVIARAFDHRAVIASKLATSARLLKLIHTDSAAVLWYVPLPSCH